MSGVRLTLPAPALWSEMTFLRSVISLQSYAWSMIFSENRYPLFGIMLELIRQSTALVARRRVDRSHQRAPVLSAPLAQRQRQCAQNASSRSSNLRWRTIFFRPCSPMAEARGLNPRQSEFESRRGHRAALSHMTTHNFLRCHPGRAPSGARAGIHVPLPCPLHDAGVLGSRVSPLSRLAPDDGRGAGESVRLQQYVPVARRQRRRLQIPFSESSTLPRHTTPSARSPHALSSEAEHPAHIGKVGASKSSARASSVRRVGKFARRSADGGQRRARICPPSAPQPANLPTRRRP